MILYPVDIMIFFFFNDTATTEIYTLSLHDALPIYVPRTGGGFGGDVPARLRRGVRRPELRDGQPHQRQLADGLRRHDAQDRKSTRLNSSHANISYAVFCLKKKKN